MMAYHSQLKGPHVTRRQLVVMCVAQKIGYEDIDIIRAQRYLNGTRLCGDFDILDAWVRMIIDEWEKGERHASA